MLFDFFLLFVSTDGPLLKNYHLIPSSIHVPKKKGWIVNPSGQYGACQMIRSITN